MKKENPSKVVIVPKPTPPETTETVPQADTVQKPESVPHAKQRFFEGQADSDPVSQFCAVLLQFPGQYG